MPPLLKSNPNHYQTHPWRPLSPLRPCPTATRHPSKSSTPPGSTARRSRPLKAFPRFSLSPGERVGGGGRNCPPVQLNLTSRSTSNLKLYTSNFKLCSSYPHRQNRPPPRGNPRIRER